MFLLSRKFALQVSFNEEFKLDKATYEYFYRIREYAVGIFEELDVNRVNFILLQLVTGLKYEDYYFPEEGVGKKGGEGSVRKSSPLVRFLLDKACENSRSAVLLYWGVCVEADDCSTPAVKLWYETMQKVILDKIQKTNPNIFAILDGQIKFRTQMKAINEQLTGPRDAKVKFLESQLKDPYNRIPENPIKRLLPTIENMFILNVDKRPFLLEKCHVWKSKTSPCGLWFHTDPAKAQPNYGLMYKNGDDLRMDGLIMQVVGLLDFLMKEVGVD